jgi:hypothetical protein
MGDSLLDNPAHWIARAETARVIAEELGDDPESKRIMLRIAEDYEELAKRAQERVSRQRKGA